MLIDTLKYLLLSKEGPEKVDLEVTVNKFNKHVKLFTEKMKSCQNVSEEDADEISTFATLVNEIAYFAPEYDYDDLPYNGFRSNVKLWTVILESALNIDNKHHHLNQFISVIKESRFLLEYCIDYHKRNYAESYPNEDAKMFAEKMSLHFNDNGRRWRIINKDPFNFPQLVPSVRFTADFMRRYSTWHLPDLEICQKLKVFLVQDYMARKLSWKLSNLTVDDVTHCARAFGESAHSKLSMIYGFISFFDKNHPISESIHPLLSSPFFIDISGIDNVKLVKNINISSTQRPIHSQVIRTPMNKASNISRYKNKLLIFVHGGAFIAPKAEAAEHIYITPWSESMPELTIINFDYSLAPESKFPTQIQELVDLYLWLRGYNNSSDSVKELLGFIPNDIVISGESAGGHIALSATLVLNDIKMMFDKNIKMPKALVLMCPKVTLCYHQYPSSISSGWDLIIFPQLLPIVGQAYIPLKKDGNAMSENTKCWDVNQNLKHNHNYQTNSYYVDDDPIEDATIRLLSIEEQRLLLSLDVYRKNLHFYKSDYLTVLNYGRYQELSDINLKIVSFEFDPFLDETVLLAKKWKGKVEMKVFDNLCHGAFIFRHFSSEVRKAYFETQKMIQSALLE